MKTCTMGFVKYLLFVFNLIFAISGLAIIIVGAVILADVGDFQQFIENRLIAPPIVLIVVGAIVFFIAFLGCFGAIRESNLLLLTFAACLLVIFISELAVGIAAAVFKNDFETVLKKTLEKSMENFMKNESEKIAWNRVQSRLECCGIESYEDWSKYQILVPSSCCYIYQKAKEEINQNCKNNNQGADYLQQAGCFGKLKMKIREKAAILIGVGIGIAFIQLIGIVLSCWLASTIRRENNK